MVTGVELTYDTGASALDMANEIFGNGVSVNSASYTGASGSSAIYSDGDAISPFVVPGDRGVILSTGNATSFTNQGGGSNDSTSTTTNTSGPNNLAEFNAVAGNNTFDASFLDVTFTPDADTNLMTMQFVFGSEEYPEFSNSVYNDVFAVWVNGVHIPLSITSSATAVTGVNQTDNINLYNSNTNDEFNTEMDGFTVTMTLTMPVNAGVENDIRIGIADASDSSFDSNVLIAADSVQTDLIAIRDEVTVQEGATGIVDVLANDLNEAGGELVVTHINGQSIAAGGSVTLATGQVVTLNADMTLSVMTDLDLDTVSFTYGIASEDTDGMALEVDTGFVTVTTIPCFVAGTMITTPLGARRVEDLCAGDLVMTKDRGAQPVRWAGTRVVAASGALAPITIRANTFGTHDRLMVSPLHRILIRDAVAELLFGEEEVLVAAKDLVNDGSVRRLEGGQVKYVHLLFDQHEVIWSAGLQTESFLPGPQTTKLFEQDIVEEICAIFPELDPGTGTGYSPAARRTLRKYEARLLAGAA